MQQPLLSCRLRAALCSLVIVACPLAGRAGTATPAESPSRGSAVPEKKTPGIAELERQEQALSRAPAAGRAAIASRIATTLLDPADTLPAYIEYAARPPHSPTALLRRLLHSIWAQYPNPEYPRGPGKDPPMWLVRPEPPIPPGTPRGKRPKPHDPEAVDWLTALAALDVGHAELLTDLPTAEVSAARAELLLRVALLRALGRLAGENSDGTRDAVLAIFQAAFVADGLLRDECGRTLRAISGPAVPTLVRIYNDRAHYGFKMRRYAAYQLDRMDRMQPRKAISAAPDDRVRAEILHAYGEVLAIDAVEAVLEQVGAGSHRVRREARWAWLRYVDGPVPPPAPKRKRKLPGGREESEEKEDYLNYRDMAVLVLGKAFQTLFGHAPDPKLSPRAQTERLFAHYDAQREEKFRQVFDAGQAAEKAGDLRRAVEEYSWILANEPDYAHRALLAPAFARYGESLLAQVRGIPTYDPAVANGAPPPAPAPKGEGAGAQIGTALGLLRVALLLDPNLPQAAKLRARIHLLDGLQAQRAGASGLADFQLAAQHDPQLAAAQTALRQIKHMSPRWHIVAWVLLGLGGLLALASLLLGRRRVPPALMVLWLPLHALLSQTGCLVPVPLSEQTPSDGGTTLIVKGAQPPFGTIRPTQARDGYNFQVDVISSSPTVVGRLYAQISGDCCDLNIDDFNVARFLYSGDATPLGTDGLRYTIDFRQTFPPCTLGFAGKMGYLIPVLATGGFRDDPKPFSPDGIGEVDRSHYWTVICP